MRRSCRRLILFTLLGGSVAGCSFLQPQPDPTQFFVLSPLATPSTAHTGELLVGIGHYQQESAVVLLSHFAGYRHPQVRMAALQALSPLLAERVSTLLIDALGDRSAAVRAVAAEALGKRRERNAEPRLLKLLNLLPQSLYFRCVRTFTGL